ncbi:MAG: Fur family transcriptional regulator [Dehalococcoidia bacterium]|nr:Fur family transcriptional regulator [Dehalococcoidia bacterium]
MPQYLDRAELADRLRGSGLRVTPQRLGVYEALASSGDHLTPERVLDRVRGQHPSMSLNTVYEVLETLTSLGAIRRGDVSAGPRRYDANMAPHHHLVCRGCGRQVDVDCAELNAPCLEPVDDHGFVVEEAQVTFYGHCEACQAEA